MSPRNCKHLQEFWNLFSRPQVDDEERLIWELGLYFLLKWSIRWLCLVLRSSHSFWLTTENEKWRFRIIRPSQRIWRNSFSFTSWFSWPVQYRRGYVLYNSQWIVRPQEWLLSLCKRTGMYSLNPARRIATCFDTAKHAIKPGVEAVPGIRRSALISFRCWSSNRRFSKTGTRY